MFFVYILQSLKDKSLYVGFTENLNNRLEDHNAGNNISTKNKRPFQIIHYEFFLNKKDALNREHYLKSGWGRRSIETMLFEGLKS